MITFTLDQICDTLEQMGTAAKQLRDAQVTVLKTTREATRLKAEAESERASASTCYAEADTAKNQSSQLVHTARKEASGIVAEAHKLAAQVVTVAKNEAEKYDRQTVEARQTLAILQAKIDEDLAQHEMVQANLTKARQHVASMLSQ